MQYGAETLIFLGYRILKNFLDYIKKGKTVEEFKLKIKLLYAIQKTVHAGYAKGFYHNLAFYL